MVTILGLEIDEPDTQTAIPDSSASPITPYTRLSTLCKYRNPKKTPGGKHFKFKSSPYSLQAPTITMEEIIGEGGQESPVWRALFQDSTGRKTALAIKQSTPAEETALEAIQTANHVIRVEGNITGQLIMQLAQYGDVENLIPKLQSFSENTKTPPDQVYALLYTIVDHVLKGIQEIHESEMEHDKVRGKIIMADLKPSNLLVCQSTHSPFRIKIADLGIARPEGCTIKNVKFGSTSNVPPQRAVSYFEQKERKIKSPKFIITQADDTWGTLTTLYNILFFEVFDSENILENAIELGKQLSNPETASDKISEAISQLESKISSTASQLDSQNHLDQLRLFVLAYMNLYLAGDRPVLSAELISTFQGYIESQSPLLDLEEIWASIFPPQEQLPSVF